MSQNQNNNGADTSSNIVMFIIAIICVILGFSSCGSSRDIDIFHNKDGSLNMETVRDMWDWQDRHK